MSVNYMFYLENITYITLLLFLIPLHKIFKNVCMQIRFWIKIDMDQRNVEI